MPPQVSSSTCPHDSPLLNLSMKSPLDLVQTHEKSSSKMNFIKRKLILTLVFVLVVVSLLRVLRITITTSSLSLVPSPKLVINTHNPSKTLLSEKEIKFLHNVILQKCGESPCNILVFGLEDQYLKFPVINGGGTTVFLDDTPEKMIKKKVKSNRTRVFKIEYKTYGKEAYELLKHARMNSSCSLRSGLRAIMSKCKLALTGLPKEVFKIKWDVIVVDGPGGDGPESPGRMGAIFMAGVLARAGKGANVVVHDVDRMIEKWFSWEFLCDKNMVSAKGKFWNFKIDQQKKSKSKKFCPV